MQTTGVGGQGLQGLQGLGLGPDVNNMSERELLEHLARMLEELFQQMQAQKEQENEGGPEASGGPEGGLTFEDLIAQLKQVLPPELQQQLQNMLGNSEVATAAGQLGLGAGGAQMSLAPATGAGIAFA